MNKRCTGHVLDLQCQLAGYCDEPAKYKLPIGKNPTIGVNLCVKHASYYRERNFELIPLDPKLAILT